MNYKYTIFILSYVIILRKYLLVPGLLDIRSNISKFKHVFMKFVCAPPCQLNYSQNLIHGNNNNLYCCHYYISHLLISFEVLL